MDSKQRERKLKRIILDIEDLKDACWLSYDTNQLDEILEKLENVSLCGYDD